MELNKIYLGDNLDILKTFEDNSIDCCVTSPPYYGLRDYGTGKWIGGDPNCPHYRTSHFSTHTSTGHKGMYDYGAQGAVSDGIYKVVCPKCGAVREDKQVGLEETPEQYIERLVNIFREVKRALKDDGTLWVNIGDTYNASSYHKDEKSSGSGKQGTNKGSYENVVERPTAENCKPKDLIGIPWMLAFALRNDGWYLRQDIIWQKPNPMPESVKDRCTKSHEYIFLLSKKSHYYFDYEAIQEPVNNIDTHTFHRYNLEVGNSQRNIRYADSKYDSVEQETSIRQGMNKTRGLGEVQLRKNLPTKDSFLAFVRNVSVNDIVNCGVAKTTAEHWYRSDSGFSYPTVDDWNMCKHLFTEFKNFAEIDTMLTDVIIETDAIDKNSNGKRNKRDVWSVCPSAFKGAHFATFPEDLITPMILAGCPKGGVVLDPFMGSGTVGVVAKSNGRKYVGCELNPEYASMAENRIKVTQKRLI